MAALDVCPTLGYHMTDPITLTLDEDWTATFTEHDNGVWGEFRDPQGRSRITYIRNTRQQVIDAFTADRRSGRLK